MPTEVKVSIFTDNDLTHINDDPFEINLVAHLLDQIYIVPVPPSRYNYYDDPHANVSNRPILSTSTGATALAPPFFIYSMMYNTLSVYKHDYVWIYYILNRYTFLILLE